MKSTLSRFTIAALSLLLAACTSPQSRIDDNPTAFSSLPAEQQALIKQGKVGVGFSEAAVKLALGEPQRISKRTDGDGVRVIWRYTRYEDDLGAPVFTGFYNRGFGAPFNGYYGNFAGAGFFPYNLNTSTRRERDRISLVFKDGKVTAIEEEVK